ncbi:hypothetical protein [Paraburkholderia xenovorans]|uniref:hypothetical protein n=1 Tax=Paraburkholderia xenovorans TaxID=36873 RepID=UPI0038BC7C55
MYLKVVAPLCKVITDLLKHRLSGQGAELRKPGDEKVTFELPVHFDRLRCGIALVERVQRVIQLFEWVHWSSSFHCSV